MQWQATQSTHRTCCTANGVSAFWRDAWADLFDLIRFARIWTTPCGVAPRQSSCRERACGHGGGDHRYGHCKSLRPRNVRHVGTRGEASCGLATTEDPSQASPACVITSERLVSYHRPDCSVCVSFMCNLHVHAQRLLLHRQGMDIITCVHCRCVSCLSKTECVEELLLPLPMRIMAIGKALVGSLSDGVAFGPLRRQILKTRKVSRISRVC